jgi:hypothetical protein
MATGFDGNVSAGLRVQRARKRHFRHDSVRKNPGLLRPPFRRAGSPDRRPPRCLPQRETLAKNQHVSRHSLRHTARERRQIQGDNCYYNYTDARNSFSGNTLNFFWRPNFLFYSHHDRKEPGVFGTPSISAQLVLNPFNTSVLPKVSVT